MNRQSLNWKEGKRGGGALVGKTVQSSSRSSRSSSSRSRAEYTEFTNLFYKCQTVSKSDLIAVP